MIRMTLAITLTQSSTANAYMGTDARISTLESGDWLCAEKVNISNDKNILKTKYFNIFIYITNMVSSHTVFLIEKGEFKNY